MNWLQDTFGVDKPVIALLHLRALPGDPLFNTQSGMQAAIRSARDELQALQQGGVDGVLIANEFSLPYQKKVDYVTVAAMARLIGEIAKDITIPFGVNVVLNPLASIDLAAATGAQFVRSTFTGAYVGESGITDTDIANILRRKAALGLDAVKLLYKVNPESDVYLNDREIETVTHSLIFHCFPDALCVSGVSAGGETDTGLISRVKTVAGEVPVLCNTGCTAENVADKMQVCDGVCVGTSLKKDGKFNNHVELARVERFMQAANAARGK